MDTQNDGQAGKRTPALQQWPFLVQYQWVKFLSFFPEYEGWANASKQSTSEANKNTMLHPNKAEHSQIHMTTKFKKKQNIFPSISFWKISPNFLK